MIETIYLIFGAIVVVAVIAMIAVFFTGLFVSAIVLGILMFIIDKIELYLKWITKRK